MSVVRIQQLCAVSYKGGKHLLHSNSLTTYSLDWYRSRAWNCKCQTQQVQHTHACRTSACTGTYNRVQQLPILLGSEQQCAAAFAVPCSMYLQDGVLWLQKPARRCTAGELR
jgi:hypothetical protein